jgi:uncharacterized membrane protein YwzB
VSEKINVIVILLFVSALFVLQSVNVNNLAKKNQNIQREVVAEIADSVFKHNVNTILLGNSLQNMRSDLNEVKFRLNDMGKLWCTVYDFMVPNDPYNDIEGLSTNDELPKVVLTDSMVLNAAGIKEELVDSIFQQANWTLEYGSE